MRPACASGIAPAGEVGQPLGNGLRPSNAGGNAHERAPSSKGHRPLSGSALIWIAGRVCLAQPSRDVALSVQDAPHVQVIRGLQVEDHVWEAAQQPRAQVREIELGRVARRASRRVLAEVLQTDLQSVNEVDRNFDASLLPVPVDRFLDVLPSTIPEDDRQAVSH